MPTHFTLLGCTHPHSRGHLNTLRLSPQVDGFRLWDPDRAAAEKLAQDAGPKLLGVTDDLAAALGDAAEFVVVCRRNDESPETLIAAARAGKHIFSEKPMAVSAAALAPVLAEVRAAGVGLGVCYQWRGHPAALDLQARVREGILGDLMAVEARMVTSQVRFRDPSHWLFSRSRAGGGILHWLGCHWLDLIRFVSEDEITHVTALTGVRGGSDIEVEDTAAVALRFRSGALGTYTAGYHLPRSSAGYYGATYDTYLGLRGRLGYAAWAPTHADQPIRVESAAPAWAGAPVREFQYRQEPCEAYGGAHGLEFFHNFMADARAGREPLAGGADALKVLEWLDAVYESAATGSTVALPG